MKRVRICLKLSMIKITDNIIVLPRQNDIIEFSLFGGIFNCKIYKIIPKIQVVDKIINPPMAVYNIVSIFLLSYVISVTLKLT